MNDQTGRLKRRAAMAALLSLLAFFLFLVGAGTGERLQMGAADPTVDVRTLVTQLGRNTTDGGREATFREVIPAWRQILGAALVDPKGKILVTYPAQEKWYGKSIATLLLAPYGPPGGVPPPGYGPPGPPGYGAPGMGMPYPGMYPNPSGAMRPPDGVAPEVPVEGADGPPGAPGPPYGAPGAPGPPAPPVAAIGPWPLMQPGPEALDMSEVPPSQIEFQMRQLLGGDGPRILDSRLRDERLRDPSGQYVARLFYFPRTDLRTYRLAKVFLIVPCSIGLILSALLYWCLLPWWVYLDARPRTTKAVPLALFVGLTNFLGWLTYLVIRPDVEQRCPVCELPLLAEFRLCPRCGYTESTRCGQCGRPARRDWRFCPYCETPRPDAEIALTPLGTDKVTR